jgi:outer membrane protein assembly factor BamB
MPAESEGRMARQTSALFVGTRGAVVAVDRASGATLWSMELKGSDFVDVMLVEDELYAASKGRLYRLDPVSGDILWRNDLPGMGWGLVSIAGSHAAGAAEKARRDAAAAAAAASGA